MTESTAQKKIIAQRILFVDDEENILRAMRRLFIDDDYEIFIAGSGRDALDILRSEREMGVIVSDQRMPAMTGVEFLEKSKELAPHAIRILLTGYADINSAVDAINRGGIFRYLHKPWQDDELRQTIQAAFTFYNLVKENKRLTALVIQQNARLKNWNKELETMVQQQTLELSQNNDNLKRLNTKLAANFKNSIRAFSSLLEMRSKSMRSHSRNIAEVMRETAVAMGHAPKEIETLVAASFLHDIGKIGIPDRMLHTPANRMNSHERQEYCNHSVRGQTAVEGVDELRNAGRLIRHHHERYDGTGFPDALKKNDIPLGARLIAIADFFDKEFRRQPRGTAVEKVCRLVEEESGRAFDPRLVPKVLKAAKKIYARKQPGIEETEMEISPNDLRVDMVVSRDVISGTGVLLLGSGTTLNTKNIATLKRYYQVDPASQGVFVVRES